jgi:GMP synthase (glutamine-hydrolysing)
MNPQNGLTFLIIDGYPKESRDKLAAAGMRLAWKLYGDMLQQHLPDARYDVLLPSDSGQRFPSGAALESYSGILWTGCNLTIYHRADERVTRQITLAKEAYARGVPSFGSCWGIQMAAVAAGGEVAAHPKGREMGLGRKIMLTAEGRQHPLHAGKPWVFDAFVSHDDVVTALPPGGKLLSGNDFARVQSLAVNHQKGSFWATQFHTEYDLYEVACLILAREEKLIRMGFYDSADELAHHVGQLKELFAHPEKKNLRWRLAVDDDVLEDRIRQCEFVNWLHRLVIPIHRGQAAEV